MMNLLPHHRLHIPNGLAVFAALLLLVSSAIGFNTSQETSSFSQSATATASAEAEDGKDFNHAAGQERRGLKLGFLLFRR